MSKKRNDEDLGYGILGLILIALGVWFFFFKDDKVDENKTSEVTTVITTTTQVNTTVGTTASVNTKVSEVNSNRTNLEGFVLYFQSELKSQGAPDRLSTFRISENGNMVYVITEDMKNQGRSELQFLADSFHFAVREQYELWALIKGVDPTTKPKLSIETTSGEVVGEETADRTRIELKY